MKLDVKNILMKTILVVLTLFNFSYTYAEECEVVVHGSDMMKFDTNEIHINKNCEKVFVNLKHSGNLPVNAMGHNIVFLETNNLQKIISKINMSHGIENGYMPEMDEILFKSKMIGGGEETTLELDPNVFTSEKEYILLSF